MQAAIEEIRAEAWEFLAKEKRIGAHLAYADALGDLANELASMRAKVLGRAQQMIAEVDDVRA